MFGLFSRVFFVMQSIHFSTHIVSLYRMSLADVKSIAVVFPAPFEGARIIFLGVDIVGVRTMAYDGFSVNFKRFLSGAFFVWRVHGRIVLVQGFILVIDFSAFCC